MRADSPDDPNAVAYFDGQEQEPLLRQSRCALRSDDTEVANPCRRATRRNDWVYDQSVKGEGENPGRTANKAREHLRAIFYWAWEQELIDAPPRCPGPRDQRDVTGRHYLTKAAINALYFATHKMGRPRGWVTLIRSAGARATLVVFFNYGVDTGTVWRSTPAHEPILWRHVIWAV